MAYLYASRLVSDAFFYNEIARMPEERQVDILKKLSKINYTGLTLDGCGQNRILPSEVSSIDLSKFSPKAIVNGLGLDVMGTDFTVSQDRLHKTLALAVQMVLRPPRYRCTLMTSIEMLDKYRTHEKYKQPDGNTLPNISIMAGDEIYGQGGLLDVYLSDYSRAIPPIETVLGLYPLTKA